MENKPSHISRLISDTILQCEKAGAGVQYSCDIVKSLDKLLAGKGFIYYLHDDGVPYYVGQSVNPLGRYIFHYCEDALISVQDYYQLHLRRRGGTIMMGIIEMCDKSMLDEREIHWIKKYTQMGVRLTNWNHNYPVNRAWYKEFTKNIEVRDEYIKGSLPASCKIVLINEIISAAIGELVPMSELLRAA